MEIIKERLAALMAEMNESQLSTLARAANLIVNGQDFTGATPIKDLKNPEDVLQAGCYQWHNKFFRRNSLLFAVPNGGSRAKLEAMKFKATGTRKGVADLILLAPGGKTYFIEMKVSGGRQEPDQLIFQAMVENLGFNYFIVWSFQDFKNLVFKLLAEFVEPNKNYV